MKKVGMKDVAKAVNVSTALVSYVLNGKAKENRVSDEMAAKIRSTAKALNYRSNQVARSLQSGKSHILGLLVADISNHFFADLARIIEDEARARQYHVIFGSSDENPEQLRDLIDVMVERQVDGIIIVPTKNAEEDIRSLDGHGVPFVLIDRPLPGLPTNFVGIDNYQAAYGAVQHLIGVGHKRIGMIAYQTSLLHMKERIQGYRDALSQAGLEPEPALLKEVDYRTVNADVDQALRELISLDVRPEAVFFATNQIAINGLKVLNALRLNVPDDLAVVTFDSSAAFDLFYAPITHIAQPVEAIGKQAVQILIDEIKNQAVATRQILLPAQLIVKNSCGFKEPSSLAH